MEITKRKALTGKRFLSFVLDLEEYCIEILKIKEIMAMTNVTPIPQMPAFLKGVLNLRGQIIPVIDLRLKFRMPELAYTDRTCIVIVELALNEEMNVLGLVVDGIKEVVNFPEEKITKLPYLNAKVKSDFIEGIAESGDGIKIVLDIAKVLTEDEVALLKEMKVTE